MFHQFPIEMQNGDNKKKGVPGATPSKCYTARNKYKYKYQQKYKNCNKKICKNKEKVL